MRQGKTDMSIPLEAGAKLLDICAKRKELESRLAKITKEEEAAKRLLDWPGMQAQIGTWKFKNSYSCPQEDSDYWWLYRRIDKILKTGEVFFTEFQIDKNGHLSVKSDTSDWVFEKSYMTKWERVGKAEWNKAVKKVSKLIESL